MAVHFISVSFRLSAVLLKLQLCGQSVAHSQNMSRRSQPYQSSCQSRQRQLIESATELIRDLRNRPRNSATVQQTQHDSDGATIQSATASTESTGMPKSAKNAATIQQSTAAPATSEPQLRLISTMSHWRAAREGSKLRQAVVGSTRRGSTKGRPVMRMPSEPPAGFTLIVKQNGFDGGVFHVHLAYCEVSTLMVRDVGDHTNNNNDHTYPMHRWLHCLPSSVTTHTYTVKCSGHITAYQHHWRPASHQRCCNGMRNVLAMNSG